MIRTSIAVALGIVAVLAGARACAESPDPRVQVQVRDFVLAPQERERRGIPWAWIAGAAVAAVVGWEIVR